MERVARGRTANSPLLRLLVLQHCHIPIYTSRILGDVSYWNTLTTEKGNYMLFFNTTHIERVEA